MTTSPPPVPAHDAQPQEQIAFAGRWRRFFAFLIDTILLGIVAGLLCSPFFEPLSHLGVWGRLIGCVVAVAYFALMEGPVGSGQSAGKRLMLLRVIDEHGEPPAAGAALVRSAIFCVPYFLNGLALPLSRTPRPLLWLVNALIVCAGGGTAYLLLFNRPTLQGLHDLAAKTYVVRSVLVDRVDRRPVWAGHWAILASLLLVFGLGGGLLLHWMNGSGPFPELMVDLAVTEAIPGVQTASVKAVRNYRQGADAPTRQLIVQVAASGRQENDESLATLVAQAILEHDPKAAKYDSLRVIVTRGFDLGLTSSWRSNTFTHAPADWD